MFEGDYKREEIKQVRDVREVLAVMESYTADKEKNPLDSIGRGNVVNLHNFIHFIGDKYDMNVFEAIDKSDTNWSYLRTCEFMGLDDEDLDFDTEDTIVYGVNVSKEYSCLDKCMCLVAEYMASNRCESERYYRDLEYLNKQIFK